MNNFRTDLAIEYNELLVGDNKDINGIEVITSKSENTITTWIKVLDEIGQKNISKPIGNYITVESKGIIDNDILVHDEITSVITDKLSQLLKLYKTKKVTVIGLGNWKVTADSLGPKVLSKVLITRHIKENLPNDMKNIIEVSGITPGVMGLTGIETKETVKSIVDTIKPDIIIVIDSLAARQVSRLNTTIQISDTGISPGSGVNNKRMGITYESIGVPVIAIGVPTVIDANTILNDCVNKAFEIANYNYQDSSNLLEETFHNYTNNMFVTTKDIDFTIDRLSTIISKSINFSLHDGLDKHDIESLLY